MEVKEHIEKNEVLCSEIMRRMNDERDEKAFYQLLKDYIRLRYLIEDDPFWDDDLDAVTKYSIRKTIERTGDPTRLSDLGINCAGASSSMTKRLLLVISFRKGLDITLDPDAVARAKTVHDLAKLLLNARIAATDANAVAATASNA